MLELLEERLHEMIEREKTFLSRGGAKNMESYANSVGKISAWLITLDEIKDVKKVYEQM